MGNLLLQSLVRKDILGLSVDIFFKISKICGMQSDKWIAFRKFIIDELLLLLHISEVLPFHLNGMRAGQIEDEYLTSQWLRWQ